MENPYAAEAEERWGGTEAYKQSQARAANYTEQDWAAMKAEAAANTAAFTAAFVDGEPAQGDRAMDLAEAHRLHLNTWFYDCDGDFHRKLGDMYVDDPRFTANYDKDHPGLAQFIRDAIHANAAR